MEEYEAISFYDEDGQEVIFCILEQTTVNGINYLMVADADALDDDSDEIEVELLKESAEDGDGEMVSYELVTDEEERELITRVFDELIEDMEIEMED